MPGVERLEDLERLEGVASGFAATRDGIDTMLRDRGLRRTSPELTAESLLRGAHANAALAGSGSSLEGVRSGVGDAVAQSALRVSVELLGLVPVFARTPLQALARLHALAAHDVGQDEIGRPRDADAALLLRDVAALVDDGRPALLTAALVHAALATGAPFGSSDAVVARAAERLVLVSSGLDAKSLVVPEAGHLALRPAYESNLRAYADGGRAGVQAWLLYCAEAYAAGAEASPLRDGSGTAGWMIRDIGPGLETRRSAPRTLGSEPTLLDLLRLALSPALRAGDNGLRCERHPRGRVPPLTRETRLPSVHLPSGCPGRFPLTSAL